MPTHGICWLPNFQRNPKKRHSGLDRGHLLRPLDSFSFTKSEGPGIIPEGENGDCDCPTDGLAHSEARPPKSGSPSWRFLKMIMI